MTKLIGELMCADCGLPHEVIEDPNGLLRTLDPCATQGRKDRFVYKTLIDLRNRSNAITEELKKALEDESLQEASSSETASFTRAAMRSSQRAAYACQQAIDCIEELQH